MPQSDSNPDWADFKTDGPLPRPGETVRHTALIYLHGAHLHVAGMCRFGVALETRVTGGEPSIAPTTASNNLICAVYASEICDQRGSEASVSVIRELACRDGKSPEVGRACSRPARIASALIAAVDGSVVTRCVVRKTNSSTSGHEMGCPLRVPRWPMRSRRGWVVMGNTMPWIWPWSMFHRPSPQVLTVLTGRRLGDQPSSIAAPNTVNGVLIDSH